MLLAEDLRCEYLREPRGLDQPSPRLSWKLRATGGERGLRQSAFQVQAAISRPALTAGHADLWDSGRVESPAPAHVPYAGTDPGLGGRCYWRVRVFDEQHRPSDYSAPTWWSRGPSSDADWHGARLVRADAACDRDPWIFRDIDQPGPFRRVTAWVASVGYHELHLNGQRVGDSVLAPAVSDLGRRLRHVTYDLTSAWQRGVNRLVAWLGAGWSQFAPYGQAGVPRVQVLLQVQGAAGRSTYHGSDESWQWMPGSNAHFGPFGFADYGGEQVDVARERAAPFLPGVSPAGARAVAATAWHGERSAECLEPTRLQTPLEPLSVRRLPSGEWRVDLGRNMTGWLELEVRAAPHDRVRCWFSERDFERCTYGQEAELQLDAGGAGRFRHRFHYFAGRFVTVEARQGPLEILSVRGLPIRSDYRRSTQFRCSSDLLTEIHATTLWTYENLTLGGYVVDCPHRERWGYGGDAHATMETALLHYEHGAFHTKWLQDWRDVQRESGDLPFSAPTREGGGGPAWSGVCVTLPYQLYLTYGDQQILHVMYPTMRSWLAFLLEHVRQDLLQPHGDPLWGFLGDWVPPGHGQAPAARIDARSTWFFNNAYLLHVLQRMVRIEQALGHETELLEWTALARRLRASIHREFFDPVTARYACGAQPYQALALLVDLPPAAERGRVALELEAALRRTDGRIDAGIHGTYFLLMALTALGRSDWVRTLLDHTRYPGWGHMLKEDATTFWEQWDGQHSLLHSSFLSVGAWFIEGLVGLRRDPRRPGYRRVQFAPGVASGLRFAEATLETMRGTVHGRWECEGEELLVRLQVPPGCEAEIELPCPPHGALLEGGRDVSRAACVQRLPDRRRDRVRLLTGSGRYEFRCPRPPLPPLLRRSSAP